MSITDPLGRRVRYLRLSLTDACSMRCTYCRPHGFSSHAANQLDASEIQSLVAHLSRHHAVRKVRLTGGEPTVRADLMDIVERLSAVDTLHELTMTTNGLTLERDAPALARAGLTRVNVSLDAIDARPFQEMTGVDGVERVIRGIEAAQRAGLTPVRLNTVVVRGRNECQLPALVRFAGDHGCEIRFIELMPMGPLAGQWAEQFVPEREMWQILQPVMRSRREVAQTNDAARRYIVQTNEGRSVTIGMITAMSCCFCDRCDRMRIGADGTVYPCLMDKPAGNLISALRPRFNPRQVDQMLDAAFAHKSAQHPIAGPTVMTRIGG